MNSFKLKFKLTSGDSFELDVPTTSTILDLKHKVVEERGLSLAELRLVYRGVEVEDDRSIDYYGINESGLIFVAVMPSKEPPAKKARTDVSPQERVKQLTARKVELEKEVQILTHTIPPEFRNIRKKPVYIDSEGYPRADIDIWGINDSRKKLIARQQDHLDVMAQIQRLVEQIFSGYAAESPQPPAAAKGAQDDEKAQAAAPAKPAPPQPVTPHSLPPFYRVANVADGSPAKEAGMCIGDMVVKFGTLTAKTNTPQKMKEVVTNSVGRAIPIVVKRNPHGIVELELVPKKWSGRGLLGCHLKPP